MQRLLALFLILIPFPAEAQQIRSVAQNPIQPARPQAKRSLFNVNKNCNPQPAQPIIVTQPAAPSTDPNLLAAILSRPQAAGPSVACPACPDYSGQLNAILANQAIIIGMLGNRIPTPSPLPAPTPVIVTTPAPSTNYYLGTAPFAPGTPGIAPFAPGTPGTAPFAPGVPGTAPFNPGTPGTAPFTPGTPGTAPFNPGTAPGTSPFNPGSPGVITVPPPTVIIKPHPPIIIDQSKPAPMMPPAVDQPGTAPFNAGGPSVMYYEARTGKWVKAVPTMQTQWRRPVR